MTQLQAARAEELSSGFKGEVLLPGDDAYENARQIWNAMVDKRPAVIARCAAVSDVVRAVTSRGTTGSCSPSAAAGTTSPAAPCATTV
jgi:hypothetical protein